MSRAKKSPTKKRSLLEEGFTHLASEWIDEKDISEFTQGSGYKAFWKCSACHKTWRAKISKRYREGTGCPHCPLGRAKSPEESILFLFPELVKEWNDSRDPKTVSPYSGYKANWRCSKCSSKWTTIVSNRTRLRNGCPYCSGRNILKGETDFATTHPELLKNWSINNTISPSDVSAGSSYQALWKCVVCNNEWNATVSSAVRGRGCPYCSGSKVLLGFNDLRTTHPHLELEWDDKKSFLKFSKGSRYQASWKCSICSQEWKAAIVNRARSASSGCPYCAGKKATPGVNDLATIHPGFIKEWDDKRDIRTVSAGSGYKAQWKCHKGHKWKAAVYSRAIGNGCLYCHRSNLISQGETDMTQYIKSISDEEIVSGIRSIIPPYELDAYLPESRIAFEYNGNYWHSDEVIYKRLGISASEYHSNKVEMCREKGVQLYFVWEDDWTDRREEVEEAILSTFNERISSPEILFRLE